MQLNMKKKRKYFVLVLIHIISKAYWLQYCQQCEIKSTNRLLKFDEFKMIQKFSLLMEDMKGVRTEKNRIIKF